MKESTKEIKKSNRGRPATTGSGKPVMVRLHDHQIAVLDAWRLKNGGVTLQEAIRRLALRGAARAH